MRSAAGTPPGAEQPPRLAFSRSRADFPSNIPEGSIVYSQFHQQFAIKQPIMGPRSLAQGHSSGPGKRDPRRLRGHAAHALAVTARRLDRDSARRAIA
jgi:hypothetical protein